MQSQTFSALGLSPAVCKAVLDQGYTTPTEIQEQSIPLLLDGSDLLGTAQTGTGKTAAFLLPIIHRINKQQITGNPVNGPLALILAPTRELAAQIDESARVYGDGSGVRHTAIFGGVPKPRQIKELKRRPHILVATPGRLLDLIQEGYITLAQVAVFVLDEGDRMLDMGFIPDVRRIAAKVPARRQTALFSATMPAPIAQLAQELLSNPKRVAAGPQEISVGRIEQEVLHVPKSEKTQTLTNLIKDRGMYKAIVFTRTKHRASRLAKQLLKAGIPTDAIHGDKSQNARQRALGTFQSGKIQVLVATDVASRGIDVDDITHVINYEIPNEPESYVHRIGRTARAGADGSAITLCDPDEVKLLRAIERLQEVELSVNRDHDNHIEPEPARRPDNSRRSPNGSGQRGGQRGGQRAGQGGGNRSGHRRPQAGGRSNGQAGGGRRRPRSQAARSA